MFVPALQKPRAKRSERECSGYPLRSSPNPLFIQDIFTLLTSNDILPNMRLLELSAKNFQANGRDLLQSLATLAAHSSQNAASTPSLRCFRLRLRVYAAEKSPLVWDDVAVDPATGERLTGSDPRCSGLSKRSYAGMPMWTDDMVASSRADLPRS
jgi:hypothetical protein